MDCKEQSPEFSMLLRNFSELAGRDGIPLDSIPLIIGAYFDISINQNTPPKRPKHLWHVTTSKKAKKYRISGCIFKPVRGFTTPEAALLWALHTNRDVVYRCEVPDAYSVHKLPDHHQGKDGDIGEAWWYDGNIDVDNIVALRASNYKTMLGHHSYCKQCTSIKRADKKQKEQQGFAD